MKTIISYYYVKIKANGVCHRVRVLSHHDLVKVVNRYVRKNIDVGISVETVYDFVKES